MPYDLSGASSKWNLCSIILTERFPRVIVTEAHPWIIFDMVLAAFYSWIWYLFSSLPEPGLTPSFGQVFVLLRYPKLSFCLLQASIPALISICCGTTSFLRRLAHMPTSPRDITIPEDFTTLILARVRVHHHWAFEATAGVCCTPAGCSESTGVFDIYT
jgi:hypothetical protein